MRARETDAPEFAGARFGLRHGLVGIGEALDPPPADLDAAILLSRDQHGEKSARMLARFAELPSGTLVWTRTGPDEFHLGRIGGPWIYEKTPAARACGIHHVRPSQWSGTAFDAARVPAAVLDTFARGGRNFQRIRDHQAERLSADLWDG